jgi:transcriptional regulator with XRE-family HTH domain
MANQKTRFDPDYLVLLSEIQAVRTASGLSQVEIAKRLGISQSTWSKIETRERRIDLIELRRFCQIVGVNFSDFIKTVDKKMS